jgi:acyl-CoA reductase-like NAD-dependent aldehyde dehydrogenase
MSALFSMSPEQLLPATPRAFSALIDGEFIRATDREPIRRDSPAHGIQVSVYPRATPDDVNMAVAAARRSFDDGVWRNLSGADRAQVILRVARSIEANRDELALIESIEVGKPITAAYREIGGAIALWDYAATLCRHQYGDAYDQLGNGALGLVFREPVGVVTMITPWNYPLLIVSQKLPFALATGCSVLIKPSELSSGTTLRLAELLVDAGIPAGVVNILAGEGKDVGASLCESEAVDMVSFTGSSPVGRMIGERAGRALKRVSLELGGKGAQVVFADADLKLAAEKVVMGITRNAGQACVSGSRLIVERSIKDDFTNEVVRQLEEVKIGDPLDASTQMGPLASQAQFDKVNRYVSSGQSCGARARVCQGNAEAWRNGHFVAPVVFDEVNSSMAIAREEIFGPVLSVFEFDTVAEAVALANSTEYGLNAGLWTRDFDKALAVSRLLRAGTVEVNTYMSGAPELPLTGHKQSGVGHEKGRYAIDEFTHLKTVQLQVNRIY